MQCNKKQFYVPEILKLLLEEIAFVARDSEFIDENSGVSARLSISAYENLVSTAERRMLLAGDKSTTARITDFWGVVPAITGKIELVYEGEQEGPYQVAILLLSAAVKKLFLANFPNPEKPKRNDKDHYGAMKAFFSDGNTIDLLNDDNNSKYELALESIPGLKRLVNQIVIPEEKDLHTYMELALFGMTEFDLLNKEILDNKFTFQDLLSDMLSQMMEEEEDEDF